MTPQFSLEVEPFEQFIAQTGQIIALRLPKPASNLLLLQYRYWLLSGRALYVLDGDNGFSPRFIATWIANRTDRSSGDVLDRLYISRSYDCCRFTRSLEQHLPDIPLDSAALLLGLDSLFLSDPRSEWQRHDLFDRAMNAIGTARERGLSILATYGTGPAPLRNPFTPKFLALATMKLRATITPDDSLIITHGDHIMGRTDPTANVEIERERAEWKTYRRALPAEHKRAWDSLWVHAKQYMASAQAVRRYDPMEPILMSIALAQEVKLLELDEMLQHLQRRIQELEKQRVG